jgi:hypothetical protein
MAHRLLDASVLVNAAVRALPTHRGGSPRGHPVRRVAGRRPDPDGERSRCAVRGVRRDRAPGRLRAPRRGRGRGLPRPPSAGRGHPSPARRGIRVEPFVTRLGQVCDGFGTPVTPVTRPVRAGRRVPNPSHQRVTGVRRNHGYSLIRGGVECSRIDPGVRAPFGPFSAGPRRTRFTSLPASLPQARAPRGPMSPG